MDRPVKVFWVVPYVMKLGRFEQASRVEFTDEHAAARAADSLARRACGVAIYEREGDPLHDVWQESELLATFGQVPELHQDAG